MPHASLLLPMIVRVSAVQHHAAKPTGSMTARIIFLLNLALNRFGWTSQSAIFIVIIEPRNRRDANTD
jgi:hypothetical protein